MAEMRYKRIMIKLSGAATAGTSDNVFDRAAMGRIVDEVLSARKAGLDVAVVIGGGNIFRGANAADWNIEPAEADNIGMLGTVINGVLLRAALTAQAPEYDVRLMSAIPIPSVAEPYIRLRAIHHLDKGALVVLVAGIGQPFVTTDYPAVQRAVETRCDAVLVAKHGVDGVYEKDPRKHPDARRFSTISFEEALKRDIKVMDQSALILARDRGLPVHIFNFDETGSVARICAGEDVGTLVTHDAVATYA